MNYLTGRSDTPPCGKCDLCSPTSESLPWDPGVRLYGQPLAVDVRLAILGAVRDHDGWFGRWTIERMLLGIPQTNTQEGTMKLSPSALASDHYGELQGSGADAERVRRTIDVLVEGGFLRLQERQHRASRNVYHALGITPKGRDCAGRRGRAARIVRGGRMSRSQPTRDAALRQRLDAAVQRLAATRRTFTEEGVLAEIWEAGYNVSPQDDSRFILGREADSRSPRHWHLAGQVVANNRLIESIEAGTWDGRDLDAELARLDREHGGHHVFCRPTIAWSSIRTGGLTRGRRADLALPRRSVPRWTTWRIGCWNGGGRRVRSRGRCGR